MNKQEFLEWYEKQNEQKKNQILSKALQAAGETA